MAAGPGGDIVVVRPNSGLSGDMLLAGFARLAGASDADLGTIAAGLGLPAGCVAVEPRSVNHIGGWGCRVALPHEHAHRTLADIQTDLNAAMAAYDTALIRALMAERTRVQSGTVGGEEPATKQGSIATSGPPE